MSISLLPRLSPGLLSDEAAIRDVLDILAFAEQPSKISNPLTISPVGRRVDWVNLYSL
jgi:hypothetical protein